MSFDIKPEIEQTAFIAPGAQVIGNVRIMANASVWPGAVLRGDIDRITVGSGSNIQDNCTLHCMDGRELVIGENVSVGHNNAVLHSCTVGDASLIGMGAIVLDNAVIGRRCLIAAGAVVTPRTIIPDGSLVMGSSARVKRTLAEEEKQNIIRNAKEYIELVKKYHS